MNLGWPALLLSGRFLLDSGFAGLQDSDCCLIQPIRLALRPGTPIPSPVSAGANSFRAELEMVRFVKRRKNMKAEER